MRRFPNSERERLIDENVHSEIGRRALKLVFIDGLTLNQASTVLGMVYSTFTDKYYRDWTIELFEDFTLEEIQEWKKKKRK